MTIIQIFIELILGGNLNDQLLQNLNISLTTLFNSTFIMNENTLIVSVCDFLLNYTLKRSGSENEIISQLKPIIMLTQTIISSNCTNVQTAYDILTKQMETIDYMIKIITNKMKNFNANEDMAVYMTW
jgi:hypothetical protein